MSFWVSFMKKWILRHGAESNVLLVPYDSLAKRETIARVVGFSGFNKCDVNKPGDNYFKRFRPIEEGIGLDKSLKSDIFDFLKKPILRHYFTNRQGLRSVVGHV